MTSENQEVQSKIWIIALFSILATVSVGKSALLKLDITYFLHNSNQDHSEADL